ncbi:omptin family outer membrane protease [Escherichia coli]
MRNYFPGPKRIQEQHFKMPYIGLTSNYLYDSFEFGRR